ncbi:proenkephalin-A-like [Xenentodon cancila]
MAATARSSFLLLAVCTCVSLVFGSNCREECARCVYRLQKQPAASALACSLECDGEFDSQRLRLCQDFLFEEENRMSVDADDRPEQEQEAVMLGDDPPTSPEHLLAKKYGSFTKRYGGFMSRRSSPPEGVNDLGDRDQEENIRQEILKIISAASERDGQGEGVVKRYGGFMRRADGEAVSGHLLEAALGRGLRKRYGGFMRRVGRPEWLVDTSRNGGVLKRSWENGSELQKRYGGFMD